MNKKHKIEEHAGIQIPIYYYEDNFGNKVYDFEEMTNEFEQKLSELDETAVVMCSVETKGELKHFADGFHEGRWEDDMEDNKRPSLLDETPTDGYANLRGC